MKITKSDNEKYRQLQIEDYLQMVSAKQKEYVEVCGSNKQTEGLFEQILTNENLDRAYKQVKRNNGAGGIDGMQVDELPPCRAAKYSQVKHQNKFC